MVSMPISFVVRLSQIQKDSVSQEKLVSSALLRDPIVVNRSAVAMQVKPMSQRESAMSSPKITGLMNLVDLGISPAIKKLPKL